MRARLRLFAALLGASFALGLPLSAPALGFEEISGFGTGGAGAGQLSQAPGIDVGPDGLVYATDFGNNRVDVFTPSGAFVRAFGKGVNPTGGDVCTTATGCQKGAGGSGATEAGVISHPFGIAVDAAGIVYVSSIDNYRIEVLSTAGAFIRSFGKGVNPAGGDSCTAATGCQKGAESTAAGALLVPTGIAFGPSETLYIANAYNSRIDVFTRLGGFIRGFGKGVNPAGGDVCTASSGCKQSSDYYSTGSIPIPMDLAISSKGEVAIPDFYNHRVNVFSLDGAFVRAFGKDVNPAGGDVCTAATGGCKQGTAGGAAGALAGANSVALDASEHLYVTDSLANRVDEFTFEGTFVRAFGEGVVNGAHAFQVCTTASGCVEGLGGSDRGALYQPYGIAVDCRGAIYAMTNFVKPEVTQIRRFAEPGVADPPCPPPAVQSAAGEEASSAVGGGGKHPKPARPRITIELNPGSGTASLIAVVSDSGTLLLKGKGVRKAKKAAKRPGEVELLIAPTVKVREELVRDGKAKVKVSLRFDAEGGGSVALRRVVKLKFARGF